MAHSETSLHIADTGYLLTAARSHQVTGEYHKALDCFSSLIVTTEPNDYYHYLRSSTFSELYQFDRAAEDIRYALQLNPDEAIYYFLLGGYLLSHELTIHGRIMEQTSHAVMEEIIECYLKSLEKDPTSQEAWLDLLEINVILRRWDDAIACYGTSRPYITKKSFQLIRSFLGCLALVLAGDTTTPEEEKMLSDKDVVVSSETYRFSEIEALLRDLQKEGYSSARLSLATGIRNRFLCHFHEPLRNAY